MSTILQAQNFLKFISFKIAIALNYRRRNLILFLFLFLFFSRIVIVTNHIRRRIRLAAYNISCIEGRHHESAVSNIQDLGQPKNISHSKRIAPPRPSDPPTTKLVPVNLDQPISQRPINSPVDESKTDTNTHCKACQRGIFSDESILDKEQGTSESSDSVDVGVTTNSGDVVRDIMTQIVVNSAGSGLPEVQLVLKNKQNGVIDNTDNGDNGV